MKIKPILINLIALITGLLAAYYFDWQVGDLVWNLWLSSLVVGYLTIILSIGAAANLGWHTFKNPPAKLFKPMYLFQGIFVVGFLLVFFTIHFVGFHLGHAVFLSGFFPPETLDGVSFWKAIMNITDHLPALWDRFFPSTLTFLLITLTLERNSWMEPLAKRVVYKLDGHNRPTIKQFLGMDEKQKSVKNNMLFRPYINVFRMHILIFVFAFASLAKVDAFILYVVVYTLYAFPWQMLTKVNE